MPLKWYAKGAAFRERPSLFYFSPSDRTLDVVAWTGVALSAMALRGAMWVLYQSFVNAGQTFYGYG